MSRFHGPQAGHKTDRGNRRNGPKGVARNHRQLKREEAEERQKVYDDAKHDVATEGEELAAELIEEEVKDAKGKNKR